MSSYTVRDRIILALTCFGEARNETDVGIAAVAWSVRNRAESDLWGDGKKDWWGEGIAGVCLQPLQYSAWNKGDPNRAKMIGLIVGGDLGHPTPTVQALANPVFMRCLRISEDVLDGKIPDPTNGATHYYASYISEPKWARGKQPSAIIGVHRYYSDIEPGYEARTAPTLPPAMQPVAAEPVGTTDETAVDKHCDSILAAVEALRALAKRRS